MVMNKSEWDSFKTLAHLIAPMSVDTFIDEYWEQKPLIVHRDDPAYHEELLSLADVDRIIGTSSVDSYIRVVQNGQEMELPQLVASHPAGRVMAREVIFDRYRNGASIVLNSIHERWPALDEMCRSLAAEMSGFFQVNVYLTPAGHARGLGTHYDTHDVFVFQSAGSKHWRLYGSPMRLPLKDSPYHGDRAVDEGEPTHEFDLRAGDTLYMPRGWLHNASSNDEASLHLTVGIVSVTWAYAVRSAVENVLADHADFRESLPVSFARSAQVQEECATRFAELMGVLQGAIRPKEVVANAVRRADLGRYPVLDGHLLDLETDRTITPQTRLRRRPGSSWRMAKNGDGELTVEFNGKMVHLPGFLADDLAYMAERPDFAAAELPSDLDDDGRMVLVHRLLREGLLTCAG
jgi:ribosomal protein L16 Arg81 hydroxylase